MATSRSPVPLMPRSDLRSVSLPEIDAQRFRLALARLPGRLHQARAQFSELTGLAAVTSVTMEPVGLGGPESLPPPVHPRCVQRLSTVFDPPCREQWRGHIRESVESPAVQHHTCPLGLLCACIPIYIGSTLVGMAKLVADTSTSAAEFHAATATLVLALSLSCQDCYVAVLKEELQSVRHRLSGVLTLNSRPTPGAGSAPRSARAAGSPDRRSRVVEDALEYVQQHYQDPELSLAAIAAAVGCSARYLTHRFTAVVGVRMRAHIVELRVRLSCHRLVSTDLPIKTIALESGFTDPGQLSRAVQQLAGMSPGRYRWLFQDGRNRESAVATISTANAGADAR